MSGHTEAGIFPTLIIILLPYMIITMSNYIVSKWIYLLLWLACWSKRSHAAAIDTISAVDLRSILTNPIRNWSKETVISFPGSSEFSQATERWTIFRPPTYRAAVRPGTVADIQKLVRIESIAYDEC